MPYLLARGKAKDYAKWKPLFDQLGEARKKYGSKGWMLFQNANDPNDITVLAEWDTIENARRYTQSDELKNMMQKMGVKFNFDVLNKIEEIKM